jgi:hypothetical protein
LHIRCNYCIRLYQPREGSVAFGVQNKLEALLLAHLTLRIIEKKLEMRNLWPPKVKGVKNSKKKLLNTTKAGS